MMMTVRIGDCCCASGDLRIEPKTEVLDDGRVWKGAADGRQ
jgi:hypothetical protein